MGDVAAVPRPPACRIRTTTLCSHQSSSTPLRMHRCMHDGSRLGCRTLRRPSGTGRRFATPPGGHH
eukprot:9454423-Prorocentrum_lima.AAC.1